MWDSRGGKGPAGLGEGWALGIGTQAAQTAKDAHDIAIYQGSGQAVRNARDCPSSVITNAWYLLQLRHCARQLPCPRLQHCPRSLVQVAGTAIEA